MDILRQAIDSGAYAAEQSAISERLRATDELLLDTQVVESATHDLEIVRQRYEMFLVIANLKASEMRP
jgi:hypothetical protein